MRLRPLQDAPQPADTDFDADRRLAALGFKNGETVFSPKGCKRCGGAGYRGHSGVFEVLHVTGDVRDPIGPNASLDRLVGIVGPASIMVISVDRRRSYCLGHDRPALN